MVGLGAALPPAAAAAQSKRSAVKPAPSAKAAATRTKAKKKVPAIAPVRSKAAVSAELVPIRGERDLDDVVASARRQLQLAPNDPQALDKLAQASLVLADWALQAEATGDDLAVRKYLERIATDFPESGWRAERLALNGRIAGWPAVGLLRLHGVLLEKDKEKACAAFRRGVAGSAAAAWQVALCELELDRGAGWPLMERSARAGHAGAQEWMARRCLGEFDVTEKDAVCAREWLIQASSSGRATAQTLLAYMMVTGAGGAPNVSRAVNLYRQAAEKGDARAQNNLGECYETGRGVELDLAEALRWYEKAAQSGVPAAQFNAGRLLATGAGGRQDLAKAREWILRAADQGISGTEPVIRWIDAQGPARERSRSETSARPEGGGIGPDLRASELRGPGLR